MTQVWVLLDVLDSLDEKKEVEIVDFEELGLVLEKRIEALFDEVARCWVCS